MCSLCQQMYPDLSTLQGQGEGYWLQEGQISGQPCRVDPQVVQQGFG